MIYDQYKAKITQIAKVFEKIKRFRILILSILLFVAAAVTGLLAARGIVYGDDVGPEDIMYGEELVFESDAFMSKTSCEYYDPKTGVWSADMPTSPGEYKVRAAAEATFGKRYGKEHVFIITARTLTVSVMENTLSYGDTPTLTGDIVAGDRIVCNQFKYSTMIGSSEISPIESNIRILNAEDKDVTDFYIMTILPKTVTVRPRTVTVTTDSADKTYDGTPLTAHGYDLTSGSLGIYNGTTDVMNVEYVSERTESGGIENVANFTVYNALLGDVTAYYNFDYRFGELTVAQRPLHITTKDASKTYDGYALTNHEIEYDVSELAKGQSVQVVYDGYGGQLHAGSMQNVLSVFVQDNNGMDVTANYNVTYTYGALTVEKRAVTFASQSAAREYTAFPLTNEALPDIVSGSLADTDVFYSSFTGTITKKGVADNTFTVEIYHYEQGDVTANYDIGYEYGKLEVTTSPLTFTTVTHEKYYDGTALMAELLAENAQGLLGNDRLVLEDWASLRNVGTVENTVARYYVLNEYDEDVTDSYVIEPTWGTLTVKKLPVNIFVQYAEKIYDGTPLTATEFFAESTVEQVFPDNHFVGATATGEQTDAGESFAYVDLATVKISCDGEDVTGNFELLSGVENVLRVVPRPIVLQTHDCEWVYDGLEHYDGDGMGNTYPYGNSEWVETDYSYSLVEGHTLAIDTATRQARITHVEQSMLANFTALTILDGKGESVNHNYEIIEYRYGTLRITPRPITVTSESGTHVYDGNVFQVWEASVTEGSIVDGQEAVFDNFSWEINVNERENIFDCTVIETATGEDRTSNYEITYEYGTLTVLPRKIKVKTHTLTWTYDGLEHYDDVEYTVDDLIVENDPSVTDEREKYHSLVASSTGDVWHRFEIDPDNSAKVIDVKDGEVRNVVSLRLVTPYGKDETYNYDIEYECGTLKIEKRMIVIEGHTHEFTYNGKEQYDNCVYTNEDLVTTGEGLYLADGEEIGVTSLSSVKNAGEVKENDLEYAVYGYRDGERIETTDNYKLYYTVGTISVVKRPLVLTSNTAEKTYDGTPLTADGYQVLEGTSLAPDHLVLMENTGSQTLAYTEDNSEYGQSLNYYTFTIIDQTTNEDVTANYEVEQRYGTLTVTKRYVYVAAKIVEATYGDAWGCSPGDYYLGASVGYLWDIVEGETLTVNTSGVPNTNAYGGYLPVGRYTNTIYGDSATIVDSEGNSTIENYALAFMDGYVEITARKIALTTKDDSKVYDGMPLFDRNEYTSDDLRVDYENGYRTLASGHTMEHFTYTYVTYVQESVAGNNVVTFRILEDGYDVTANYEIVYDGYGTLTIAPRPIKVQTHDHTWMYDGIAHSDADDCEYEGYGSNVVIEEGYNELVSGHNLKVDLRTYVTDVWDTEEGNNVLTVNVIGEDGGLYGGDGYLLTENYDIDYEYGTLTVTPRRIKVKTHDCEWTYDGMAHSDGDGLGNTYGYSDDDLFYGPEIDGFPLADGDELRVSDKHIASSVTNVWESVVNDVQLRAWRNGEDITENYHIVYSFGTLKIVPRKLAVQAKSETYIYNGYEQTIEAGAFELVEVKEYGYVEYPVDGHTLTVQTWGAALTNVGETMHAIEPGSAVITDTNGDVEYPDGDGHLLIENYDIGYADGMLTIVQRPLRILTHTVQETYDGNYHWDEYEYTAEDVIVEGEYLSLVEGHVLTVASVPNRVKNTWESCENRLIFAVLYNGEDISYNYDLTAVEYGMLIIDPRPILVQTHDHSWTYDGQEHFDREAGLENCTYDENSLLLEEGYYPLVYGETLAVTGIGSVLDVSDETGNNVVDVQIYDTYGDLMTDNYAIDQRYGTLSITPRPVYVTKTHDCEWEYDGETHFDGDGAGNVYDYSDADLTYDNETYYPLVAGEELRVWKSTEIVNVWETTENVVGFKVYRNNRDISKNYSIVSENYGILTILPRAVTVAARSEDKIYDGTPLTVEPNEYDILSVNDVLGQHRLAVETSGATCYGVSEPATNYIVEGSARVTDENGSATLDGHELLENYEFTYVNGTVSINRRPILIVTRTHTWTYNGQEWSDTEPYTEEKDMRISGGYYDLVLDHEILCVSDPLVLINAGSVKNVLEFRIVDAFGNDVTDNYELGYDYGELTVDPLPIKIRTHTHTWEYDGRSHSDRNSCEDGYTESDLIVDGVEYFSLVEGHYLESKTATSIIDVVWTDNGEVGSKLNAVSFYVKDADGNDMSGNYKISYERGTLTLTPRYITLLSASAQQEYDGTPLTAKSYTVESGEIASTDKATATYTGSQTNAYDDEYPEQDYAVGENTFSVKIFRGGKDVTKNYVITYLNGELRVDKRAVTLRSLDDTREYDGEPLVRHEAKAVNGTSIPTGQAIYGTYTGSQTTVGQSENLFEPAIRMKTSGRDTTKNYIITVEYGTLTVNHRRIRVAAMSDEKAYDGTPLSVAADLIDVESVLKKALPEGHTFTATTTGATCYEIDGNVTNYITENTLLVLNGAGENVTDNFEVLSWSDGNVNIIRRAIRLETKSYEKPYDGTPLTDEYEYSGDDLYLGEYFGVTYYELLSGHSLALISERVSVQYVWDTVANNNVLVFAILDENGGDVSDKYDTSGFEYGTLTITPLSIAITTDSAEKVYDGEELTADGAYLTGTLAPNETYELTATGALTDAGNTLNGYRLTIWSADGLTETTENYTIDDTGVGMLVVTSRRITVQVHSHHDWTYNGKEQYDRCEYTEADLLVDGENYALVSGHALRTIAESGVQFVTEGEILNDVSFCVIDAEGIAVYENNYDIQTVEGTLKLNKLAISVTTNSLEWAYDGIAHFDGDGMDEGDLGYSRYDGILGAGDRVVIDESTLVYLTEVGSVRNEIELFIMKDGNDVSENYDIDCGYGTLTVRKRKLSVSGYSESVIYNGEPLIAEAGAYAIEVIGKDCDGLLSGHTFAIDTERTVLEGIGKTVVTANGKTWTITDENGENVSAYYDVHVSDGCLEITPRAITVQAASQKKTYDGKTTWEIEAGSYDPVDLVKGHSIRSLETSGVSAMEPGTYEHYVVKGSLVIVDENGNDVSGYYAVTYEDGTLEVKKASLTIATEGASKRYDGEALTNPDHNVKGLLDVHEIRVTVTGTRTEVGRSENTAEYVIVLAGTDTEIRVDDYYEVTTDFGDLIVYGDNTLAIKPIDETEHIQRMTTLEASNTLEDASGSSVSLTELVAKGYFYIAEVSGTQNDVGSSEATIDSFALYDPNGNEVTGNYNVEYLPGTLTITDASYVYVQLKEALFEYNGNPWSIKEHCRVETYYVCGMTGDVTVDLEITDELTLTNIDDKVSDELLRSYLTVEQNGVDVTDECVIVFSAERMAITPRELVIVSDSAEKLYDGTPLTANSYNEQEAAEMLVEGHALEVVITGEQIKGGGYNTIESVTVYDADGNDVTKNYAIAQIEGWLYVAGGTE